LDLPIRLIRWFNHAIPWIKFKHSLAKWAGRRLPTGQGPRVYGGVQGRLKMRLDLASESERWMYLNNYELIPRRILNKVLRAGDIFVDCGANVGFLAMWAARRVGPGGRVYAFEPMPPTVERLRENVSLNDIQNVEIVANGTWDSTGIATIYWFENTESGFVSLGKREGLSVEREYTIETVRLDDLINPPIRAIKIDVEGAELATLRGAEKLLISSRPHILMELNPVTCECFGYQPIDLISWVLQRLGDYRVNLLKSRKCLPIDWQELRSLLHDRPGKLRNVWLSPTES